MDLKFTKCAVYKKKTGQYVNFAKSTLLILLKVLCFPINIIFKNIFIKDTVSQDGFGFVDIYS
jgi:hypothetical protein